MKDFAGLARQKLNMPTGKTIVLVSFYRWRIQFKIDASRTMVLSSKG